MWLRWLLVTALAVASISVDQEGAELSSDQKRKMPDMSDMEVRKVLKCGLCAATVREFGHTLAAAEREAQAKGAKLKNWDYADIMDQICTKGMDGYGLILKKDGTPSNEWSNEESLYRAKGGQISRLVRNVCSEVYDEHEDLLRQEAPKLCEPNAEPEQCRTTRLARRVCGGGGMKFCSEERLSDMQVLEDHARTGVWPGAQDEAQQPGWQKIGDSGIRMSGPAPGGGQPEL